LSMVFGGLVTLTSVANLAFQRARGPLQSTIVELARRKARPDDPDPLPIIERVRAANEELLPVTTALGLTKLVLSLLLIVVGLGLYRRRAAARSGAIAWSIAALLAVAGEALVQARVIVPRMQAAVGAELLDRRFAGNSHGLNVEQLARLQGHAAVW